MRNKRYWIVLIGLLLATGLACAAGDWYYLAWSSATPTPTRPAMQVELQVTVLYLTEPSPEATAAPTFTPRPTATPSPTPIPTATPVPTDPPSPTPSPVPLPSPTATATPGPSPTPLQGTITLLEPAHNTTLSPTVVDFEFKWKWDGPGDTCDMPPGYAFSLRIWAPGYEPVGAMDVYQNQDEIYCDPSNGVYSFTVSKLKHTPGAQAVAVQTAATGPFNWDVVLYNIHPELTFITSSAPRTFIIPSDYVGPYDTSRPSVTCDYMSDWLEAQALFLATGGPGQDLNNLDPDGNGVACDDLRN